MADPFRFRQTVIAGSLAAIRIPSRPPETTQEAITAMDAAQGVSEEEKTSQSDENGDWLSGVDFESEDEALVLPVFDGEPKHEQAAAVRIIGERLRQARELCNMSQIVAAKRFGYANSSKLSKIEAATDTNSVPLWLIVRASKLYDVSIDYLFGLTDDFEVGLRRGVQTWLIGELEKKRIRDMAELEKLHRRVAAVSSILPAIAEESERTAEAIQRFAEINAGFDDMRGGARIAAAAESLNRHARDANAAIQRFHIEIRADKGSCK